MPEYKEEKIKAPEIDVVAVRDLLTVVHETAQRLPNLISINQAAMLKLLEINEEVTKLLEDYNAAVAKQLAEKKAKAEAEEKERLEMEAKANEPQEKKDAA